MIILIFILGLIVGSFLNALIFRLHSGESFVKGRSHCNFCKHELTALDLVPVFSFMFLRGRCRYCQKPISWQYPAVEIITAITFVLLLQNYGLRITDYGFWIQLIFASILIVIAVFDLKHYLILDKVIWPAFLLSIMVNLFLGGWHLALWGLLAGLGLAIFFGLQFFLSRGRWIGFGDVKLGLVLGSILNWPLALTMLALAYFIGAIVGIGLIVSGKKQFSSKIAFGTFLAGSAIITMIWGAGITNWYLKLIGL